MGAGPHRSGYNRRRKSQTIKLLPKKNSALLLLSSRSEKKGRNISLSLVAFLSEMDVIFDDARQVQMGDPLQTFQSHRVIPPRVWESGPVGDATCEHKNPGDFYFFRGKKRRRFSSMCDVRCFKPIVRFSCHLTLFFFFFFPPFSSFLSTGRLDSGDGWFVKSIGKSRSFSVTSSTPDCDRPFHVSVRATDFFFPSLFISSILFLSISS